MAFLAGHALVFDWGDGAQHVAGWLFYARDTWHFPLLRTERLNHPEGASIVFTDSIPLAALLFKPFVSWLPAQFHYLGLWHVIIFVSQAIGATFLMRRLGVRHVLAVVAAVLFAMTWPALLFRSAGHTALMTHGIILCALGLYFAGRDGEWNKRKTTVAFIALCLGALAVHPYFLAFCYPLFLAFLADQGIAGEGWRRQWPAVIGSVAAIAIVGAVLGYFTGDTDATGFGLLSMNLLAPFCSGGLNYFYACAYDATGYQYEGLNYFGAGVLLLLAFVIATQWSTMKALPRRYPALAMVVTLFTLYALSNAVYAGSYRVLAYPLPSLLEPVTGTFRASGRFFWVVGYLMLFATLAGLLKKPSWHALLLMAIAVPLQWIDLQPLKERHKQGVSARSNNDLLAWAPIMADVDKIHLYPEYGCGKTIPDAVYVFFQRMAARYGKLFDTSYIARPDVDCESNQTSFDAPFETRHLYIMPIDWLDEPAKVPAGFSSALQDDVCVRYWAVLLCQPGITRENWAQRAVMVRFSNTL